MDRTSEITMTPTRESIRTYLTWTLFVFPSAFLWLVTGIFIVPKLQQICLEAGLPDGSSFWHLLQSAIQLNGFAVQNVLAVLLVAVVMVGLLEWRSTLWRRHRSLLFGSGAFLLNSIVLLSLFVMMLGFALAAPALRQGIR